MGNIVSSQKPFDILKPNHAQIILGKKDLHQTPNFVQV